MSLPDGRVTCFSPKIFDSGLSVAYLGDDVKSASETRRCHQAK